MAADIKAAKVCFSFSRSGQVGFPDADFGTMRVYATIVRRVLSYDPTRSQDRFRRSYSGRS